MPSLAEPALATIITSVKQPVGLVHETDEDPPATVAAVDVALLIVAETMVCVLPEAPAPVRELEEAKVVFDVVTASAAIVLVAVAAHGKSAVMKIYPVAPLAIVAVVNGVKILTPPVPGVVRVDNKVADPSTNGVVA